MFVLVVLLAGITIKKMWPTGVFFLVLFTAGSNFLNVVLPYLDNPQLDPMDTSISGITILYLKTLAIYSCAFFLTFGLKQLFSKKESSKSNLEAEESDAPDK